MLEIARKSLLSTEVAAIWHCLNHYSYVDATFLAERLFAEVGSDEALFLVATSYYRSGKPGRAYSVLHTHGTRTAQLRLLMARCCFDLGRLEEAETVLTGGSVMHPKTIDELALEYGEMAGFALQLLGLICARTERLQRAAEALKRSLKLNPFLWHSFVALCDQGDKCDPSKIFRLDSLESFSNCHGSTVLTLVNNSNSVNSVSVISDSGIINNALNSVSVNTPENIQQTPIPVPIQNTPVNSIPIVNTPIQSLSSLNSSMPLTSLNSPVTATVTPMQDRGNVDSGDGGYQAPRKKKMLRIKSMLGGPWSLSPITPSFGVLPLDVSPMSDNDHSSLNSSVAFLTTSPLSLSQLDTEPNTKIPPPISKRILCRTTKDSPVVLNKPAVFAPAGNNSNFQSPPTGQPNPNVRRSSRLFGNSSSVKENNKSRFVAPKSPARKAKTRSSKSQSSLSELNEKNKSENQDILSSSDKLSSEKPVTPQSLIQQAFSIQKLCSEGLMSLLRDMGAAYQQLAQYNCRRAIDLLTALPTQHYRTGWVLAHIGKAYFELNEYHQAAKHFCFQVDPNFAYAYTLLGHEHIATEELDKAISCYRSAVRIDPRHYNAWYGIGLVLFKQERYAQAEAHFKRALSIHPHSSVLMCHVAVVEHALQKSSAALATLNRALKVEPRNPLCKYHRASILHSTDHHQEALDELNHLKEIVPKESNVYFLLGKVHKKLGQTHLALMNFSWALDLDPKGANNPLKEAIDPAINRFPVDDDDTTNNNPHDNGSDGSSLVAAESSQESLILEPQQLPNMESVSDDSL
ncbi:cell division cycle protein 27 homolog [Macrobrachium nipponense]|uniref:cell division cycle protein 27 homolog n=1 Tax=Macrobrachium nipponense TaxID=159736 RepID=UPI0030C7AE59